MKAVVASGVGRYGDPWHPFAATSALVADVLRGAGFSVTVDHDVDHATAALVGVDLLVVNAGDPWRDSATLGPPPDESLAGLAAALERGIGVLALHAAVSSLRDHPVWPAAVGATWLPGVSWHPPAGAFRVTPTVGGRRVLGDLGPFEVHDERYLRLQWIGASQVVAELPDDDGGRSPAAWVRRHGRARVAADLLGHDERSYSTAGHQELVQRLAQWAVGADVP